MTLTLLLTRIWGLSGQEALQALPVALGWHWVGEGSRSPGAPSPARGEASHTPEGGSGQRCAGGRSGLGPSRWRGGLSQPHQPRARSHSLGKVDNHGDMTSNNVPATQASPGS